MSPQALKRAHNIALGALIVALLPGAFAMYRGDVSPRLFVPLWALCALAILLSYAYFARKGKIQAEND